MYKITGYRIINGNTVTHLTRCSKWAKTIDDIIRFETNTATRYMLKDEHWCECWAIYSCR